MHRMALTYLQENWLTSLNRKPLIIRGARSGAEKHGLFVN